MAYRTLRPVTLSEQRLGDTGRGWELLFEENTSARISRRYDGELVVNAMRARLLNSIARSNTDNFISTGFWFKRFVLFLVGAFVIIGVAQLLKGHDMTYSATQGAIWGVISALIFTLWGFYQARRRQHCDISNDTPETKRHL